MDHAVALVETYLRMNGFFTVSEYPLIGRDAHGWRNLTDIDILAVRFPRAGEYAPRGMAHCAEGLDAALSVSHDGVHMLIGEVKEGKAELNRAAADPKILATALARFGCCEESEADRSALTLVRSGRVVTPCGHPVELVSFGTAKPDHASRHRVILLNHVVAFIREFVKEHWATLRVAQFKDPILGMFVLEAKAGIPLAGPEAVPHETTP